MHVDLKVMIKSKMQLWLHQLLLGVAILSLISFFFLFLFVLVFLLLFFYF